MTIELIKAAASGDLTTIHTLLNPYAVDNQLNMQAARFPNVNFQEKFYGNTPLHCALQGKHFDVVDALIYYGADASITNFRGLTPVELYHEFYTSDAIERSFEQQLEDTALAGTDSFDGFNPYSIVV